MILFFINLGSKEIFNILEKNNFVYGGVGIIVVAVLLSLASFKKKYDKLYFFSIVFFLFLCVFSFRAIEPEYGLQKAVLGLLIPLAIFNFFSRRYWEEEELIQYLIISVLVVSVVGILFKIRFGFYDRYVVFGFLGAIPFGWVNGMAFLGVALKKNKKKIDFILMSFFFLMIIWTGSKGPLLAAGIISILFFNRVLGHKKSTKFFVLLLVLVGFIFIKNNSDDIRSVNMIIEFIENPEEYSETTGAGSIGVRGNYIERSLGLFSDNMFFGVGFGAWNNSDLSIHHKYPHNILLEQLSEVGLFGFLFFILMLLQLKYKSIFGYIGIFGLISLLFSGDFSYFRYAFFPLLISTYLYYQSCMLKMSNIK